MKVFYKDIENPMAMLDENSSTLEELRLPSPLLAEFEEALRDGTNLLPQSARKFQDWNVAILDRYERHASMGMDRNPLMQKPSPAPGWPEGIEGIDGLLE